MLTNCRTEDCFEATSSFGSGGMWFFIRLVIGQTYESWRQRDTQGETYNTIKTTMSLLPLSAQVSMEISLVGKVFVSPEISAKGVGSWQRKVEEYWTPHLAYTPHQHPVSQRSIEPPWCWCPCQGVFLWVVVHGVPLSWHLGVDVHVDTTTPHSLCRCFILPRRTYTNGRGKAKRYCYRSESKKASMGSRQSLSSTVLIEIDIRWYKTNGHDSEEQNPPKSSRM